MIVRFFEISRKNFQQVSKIIHKNKTGNLKEILKKLFSDNFMTKEDRLGLAWIFGSFKTIPELPVFDEFEPGLRGISGLVIRIDH